MTLSPRQRDLLIELAKGLPNKMIAERLGVTIGTVKMMLHILYQKHGVANRTALVVAMIAKEANAKITPTESAG